MRAGAGLGLGLRCLGEARAASTASRASRRRRSARGAGHASSSSKGGAVPCPCLHPCQCRSRRRRGRASAKGDVGGDAPRKNGSGGSGAFGPEPGPDWVQALYQQAEDFPEETYLQELLKDTGGDPAKIEANARRKLAESNLGGGGGAMGRDGGGGGPVDAAQMRVTFDKVDPFSTWVWFSFYDAPSEPEREMLLNVLDSWFILGKLGAFNTLNLQLSNSFESGASFFSYDVTELESSLPAMFHEMEQPEFHPSAALGRFWVNIGTCDEIAFDMLINALNNFSREYVGIREVQVGGAAMAGWDAPARMSAFQRDAEATQTINDSIREDLRQIYPEENTFQ